jgi:AAA domain
VSPPRVADAREADVIRSAAARLSGPEGLTQQHNAFARWHALAEIAGEFTQGARVARLERATNSYLENGTVVSLGRVDGEDRFTTRDLLACEQSIVESARRRTSERSAVLRPRMVDLVLADLPDRLNDQQAEAARAIVSDGQGVSLLQALAETGKTRVLGVLARIYEAAGWNVLGVAPTGRAARELADSADIQAFTIHRLVADLAVSGPLAPSTVVLFDEAGSAPTRPSADLFAYAEQARAKVIAAGDSGQLPSVAAGGCFVAIAHKLGGPELREVIRQYNPSEREALEALHDGNPEPYLEFAHQERTLTTHEREQDALAGILADWDRARREHGPAQAVMIARHNTTRAMLNARARELLARDRTLPETPLTIADQDFRVGDRVLRAATTVTETSTTAPWARSPRSTTPPAHWRSILTPAIDGSWTQRALVTVNRGRPLAGAAHQREGLAENQMPSGSCSHSQHKYTNVTISKRPRPRPLGCTPIQGRWVVRLGLPQIP